MGTCMSATRASRLSSKISPPNGKRLSASESRARTSTSTTGLTGTTRARPGLREALAATRDGDTLVVTKLDRLARSLPDARDIADELTIKGVALSLGGSVYDPNDAVGRLLFNVLGMVAEFEADLIRLRTREGMVIARSKGKLKGKKPKLSPSQRKHLLTLHAAGEHTQAELAELFNVSRTTIYRELRRTTADT